jgi:hypothetical protein
MQTETPKTKENVPGETLALVLWWVAMCVLIVSLAASLVDFLESCYPDLFRKSYYLAVLAVPARLLQPFMQWLWLSLWLFIFAVLIKLLGRFVIAVENIAGKMQRPGA